MIASPFRLLTRLIDPFAAAEGPPPRRILPFSRWALKGAGKALALAACVSILAGTSELVAAWFTGWAIDTALAAGPGAFPGALWGVLIAGVAFFALFRPAIFAIDASMSSVLVQPHLFPLVLSRINRHALGHSMR